MNKTVPPHESGVDEVVNFPKGRYFSNLANAVIYRVACDKENTTRKAGILMVCMVESPIHEKVLEVIRAKSPLPTDLIRCFSDEMSYREVQDILAELIESGEVELDSSLHLRINPRAA